VRNQLKDESNLVYAKECRVFAQVLRTATRQAEEALVEAVDKLTADELKAYKESV